MIAEADAIEAAVHAPVASPAPAAAPVAAPVAAAPASPVSAVPDESMKVLTPHPDGSYTWEPYQPNGAA
jgi:hypothetical protein